MRKMRRKPSPKMPRWAGLKSTNNSPRSLPSKRNSRFVAPTVSTVPIAFSCSFATLRHGPITNICCPGFVQARGKVLKKLAKARRKGGQAPKFCGNVHLPKMCGGVHPAWLPRAVELASGNGHPVPALASSANLHCGDGGGACAVDPSMR